MNKNLFSSLMLACSASVLFAAPGPSRSPYPDRKNIALGKTFTPSYKPNFGVGSAPGWEKRLTDGVYADTAQNMLWDKPECVAWKNRHNRPLYFTIDLGEDKPISGVSFAGCGATRGTVPPQIFYISVSTDGKTFFPAGELVSTTDMPDAFYRGKQNYLCYSNGNMKTHGRYVQFLPWGMPTGSFYSDEIEIYEGKPEYLKIAYTGKALKSGEAPLDSKQQITLNCQHRMRMLDIDLQNEIASKRMPAAKRASFEAQRKQLLAAAKAFKFTGDPATFTTLHPVCDVAAKQFDLLAAMRIAEGFAPVTVWTSYRYDTIYLNHVPPKKQVPKISIRTIRNDLRAGVFNVTNYTGKPLEYKFSLKGAAFAEATVHQVQVYDDANFYGNILSAVVPLKANNGIYTATVPNGMTGQIWIEFGTKKLRSGYSSGNVEITTGKTTNKVDVSVYVEGKASHPAQPTLSCPMYEFIAMRQYYGVTDKNVAGIKRDLETHLIDTAFGSRQELKMPQKGDTDAKGHLTKPVDFSGFEKMVSLYPNARHYFFYICSSPNEPFAGFKPGTPEFNTAVTEWAKSWDAYLKAKNFKKWQVRLNFLDEPNRPDKIATTVAYMKAFKAGTDYINISENPNRALKGNEQEKEMIRLIDTFQLPRRVWADPKSMEFIRASKRPEATFEVIGASAAQDQGPHYFRVNPLICYDPALTGAGFWCYSYQNCLDRRNEYLAIAEVTPTPSMLTIDGAIPTKLTKALADGIRDFDVFRQMKDQKLAQKLAQKAGHDAEKPDRDGGYTAMRAIESAINQALAEIHKQ